jgi:peptide/nickel transport system substrate-binding protein
MSVYLLVKRILETIMRMRFLGLKLLMSLIALGSCIGALAQEPQRGGILQFGIAAEPPTYDCHATGTFAVLQRVAPHYSTLLKYEQFKYPNIVGDLAESWTVSPDKMTYTFKLRPNVKFHDGSTLTSEDVKASYDRIMSPPPGIVSDRGGLFRNVAKVETPDARTIVFRMKEVDLSIMESGFASPWNCIYSAAKLRADPNFPARNVMGTGPFKFVEHVAGSHWVGVRFDDYFQKGKPYLDGFRAITLTTSAMLNAMEGEHILAEFRGFSPPERDRIVRALGDKVKVYESDWLFQMLISFNTKKKPFDDERVRRALSLAIDRWGGSNSLRKVSSLGPVGGLLMPSGKWSASEAEMVKWPGYGKNIEANRAEARRLLKEAGAENLSLTLTNRNIAPFVASGIYVIDQWRHIGVKAQHKQLETAAWFATRASGDFEALFDSFVDLGTDPSTGLEKYVSGRKGNQVITNAEDPKLDELYDEQARTIDPAKRRRLVREFETRAMEKAYAVPFLHMSRYVVLSSRVRGWTISPSQMIYQDLADVWLAPAKK